LSYLAAVRTLLAIVIFISVPCSFFNNDCGPAYALHFDTSGIWRFIYAVSSASTSFL
jgi:hypothetical protein